MMLRLSTILWTLVVLAAGSAMFQVKYEVGLLEDRLAQLNRDIAASREETRVLDAEWSLLSDPQRLDRLNKTFLHLMPVAAAQIGGIDRVPLRPGYSVAAPMLAKAGP
jgi:hypothetical protein